MRQAWSNLLMSPFRLLGVLSLLLCTVTQGLSRPLTAFTLASPRLKDWAVVHQSTSETLLRQGWSLAITGLPRGVESTLMVSYQAEQTASTSTAERRADALQDIYNGYAGKGYNVSRTLWPVKGKRGIIINIQGLTHDLSPRIQRALIYSWSLPIDSWVVWVEVRQTWTADTAKTLDNAFERTFSKTLAETLVADVAALWHEVPSLNPPPSASVVPAPPASNPPPPPPVPTAEPPSTPVPSPSPPVAERPTPPAVNPPPPAEPVATIPPSSVPTVPSVPVPPATQVTPVPPATPVTPATPATPVTPATPATPATTPAVSPARWTTDDGRLSLVVPAEWRVIGKAPTLLVAPSGVSIRLYPAETYRDAHDLTQLLADFVTGQQEISRRHFAARSLAVPDGEGVQVTYTNAARRTVHARYLGRHGHVWRLEVELLGQRTQVPEPVQRVLESVLLQ
jgi:hypothetical protein